MNRSLKNHNLTNIWYKNMKKISKFSTKKLYKIMYFKIFSRFHARPPFFLLDQGYYEQVRSFAIRTLPNGLSTIPSFACQCTLNLLDSRPISWNLSATASFKQMMPSQMRMKIFKKDKGILFVDLAHQLACDGRAGDFNIITSINSKHTPLSAISSSELQSVSEILS